MPFKFECPSCGQHISADYEQAGSSGVCPTCASEFVVPSLGPPNPVPRQSPAPRSTPTMMRCPKCAQDINVGASVCPYCRTSVAWQSLSTQHPVAAGWGAVFGLIGFGLSFVIQPDFIGGAYQLTFGANSCACCGAFALFPVLLVQAVYAGVAFMIGLFIGLAIERR